MQNAGQTAAAAKAKSGPLSGVRVLDLTSVLMGPYCTQILSDLGADVIKVENPEGDTTRFVGGAKRHGRSGMFSNLNRGKRCITLDLRNPAGRDLCLRLAGKADVMIHSIRLQALQRLGLDYPKVRESNPDIIYCNLFGYGRDGRYSGKPVYDDTIQAISGMSMLQAEMHGEPQYVTTVLCDKIAALSAVYAINAALFSRQRGSGGQEIDVPMFESMASFLLAEHISGALYVPPLTRPVYERPVTPYRRPYKTRNGYLSVLVYNDKQWRRFVEISGRPELAADPRFASQADRSRNIADFCRMVADILLERDSEVWVEALEAAEIPVAKLNRMDDLFSDPHLQDVGFFKDLNDPLDGHLRLPSQPVLFSRTPAGFETAGPMQGEHTDQVLHEFGLENADIAALRKQGAFGPADTAN